jgi:hypothetical protein
MDGDLLGLHREVNAIAWRQSQLGRRISGDVGGQPRCAGGMLVGSPPDHGSAMVEFGDRHLDGVARAAMRFVAVHGDRRWVEQRHRDSSATTSGAGCHARSSPLCRITPSACAVPPTRFTPANRARTGYGFDDLPSLEHEHPVGEGEHIEEVVAHQHRGASVTGQHQRHRHAERQAQRRARPAVWLSTSAVVDFLVINDQKCGQSTLAATAISGSTTNRARIAAGT